MSMSLQSKVRIHHESMTLEDAESRGLVTVETNGKTVTGYAVIAGEGNKLADYEQNGTAIKYN